ncbi:MAG: zinc-ribbon domain-containing protein [Promethearchaeota archaeon]
MSVMKPYCKYCGKEINDSWNVCPNCGKALKDIKSFNNKQDMFHNRHIQLVQIGPGNSFGALALVGGIIGVFFLGFIFGIIAMIFGGIGISKDLKKGMAIGGLILGIIDLMYWFAMLLFIFNTTFPPVYY